MMKFVSLITNEKDVKTIVSLNPIMVDGTAAAGSALGARINLAALTDPEFDGHQVDYDELMLRLQAYCGIQNTEFRRSITCEHCGEERHDRTRRGE